MIERRLALLHERLAVRSDDRKLHDVARFKPDGADIGDQRG